MKKLVVVAFGFLPLFAVAGSGQYHVCTDADGKKTFTSQPCAKDEAAEVRSYSVSDGAGSSKRLSTDNPIYQQMKSDNRRADIDRSIKIRNKNIADYGTRMESELKQLRRKKQRAANNGAGATWEVSISEEMSAVTQKYTTLIGIERDRLNELNSELAGL
jgi:hypothetical protein